MAASVKVEIQGMARVLARLNAAHGKSSDVTMRTLMTAGFLVQRQAMKYTPVEYGFLRASAFTRKAQDGSLAVEVGYGAKYAVYVHENTAMKLRGLQRPSGLGTYWNPGTAKFLHRAFVEMRRQVLELVKKANRLKRT